MFGFILMVVEAARRSKHKESTADLLEVCLKIYHTLLTIGNLRGGADLSKFEFALNISLEQVLAAEQDIAVQGIMSLRSKTTWFVNRFLCSNPEETLVVLGSKCEVGVFLDKWVYSMQYINTQTGRVVNAVAILAMVRSLPPHLVLAHFEQWMKHVVPEIEKWKDGAGQVPKKMRERPRDRRNLSHRGEELLKHSSPSPDLLSLFKASVQSFEARLRENNLTLNAFEDSILQENVMRLLQSN